MTESETRQHLGLLAYEEWPSYAWPGCYTIVYVMDDGEVLCGTCMNEQKEQVHFFGDRDGWLCEGADVECESETGTWCAHCNRLLVEGFLDDTNPEEGT